MKRQGIYWLVNKVEPLHQAKAQLLAEIDFEVTFFASVDEITSSLNAKRVSIVIIGDEGEESQCIQAIDTLSNLPVIQGARLILSQSIMNVNLCRHASGNGFRDIIPINLDENKIVARVFSRFLFIINSGAK